MAADLTDPIVLVAAGGVALALRRVWRRGSLVRMWCRLWLYTWRERVRKVRRDGLGWRLVLESRRPPPAEAAWPPARARRVHGGAAQTGRIAHEGEWVGNVFRPQAFMRARPRR